MKLQHTLSLLLTAACLSAAPAFAQTEMPPPPAAPTDTTMMMADTTDDGQRAMSDAETRMHNKRSMRLEMGMDDGRVHPARKFYTSSGFDAALFQTAFLRRPGRHDEFTYLRFSYFVNLGFDVNYDFDNNFGIFTGLGIKNMGFTQKESDSTIKRRVYTIGAPLGLKIGNLGKRQYMILGGGIDVPFNYREKAWVSRKHKHKMNEWFSDRNEDYMTYLFVGASISRGTIVKLQYYPGNFLNQDYQQTNADGSRSKPFYGWDTHELYLSIGFDIQGKKHHRHEPKTDGPVVD